MPENKDEYIYRIKTRIDELNKDLDRLTDEAAQAEGELRDEYKQQMHELRKKLKEFEGKVAAAQGSDDSGWEDLKQGLGKSWETWKKSFSRAREEFERAYREGRKK